MHYRLIAQIDVELLDSSWTEQDLLDNFVMYLDTQLAKGEAEDLNRAVDNPAPFTVDLNEGATVWTEAGYAEEHADLIEQHNAEKGERF